MQKISQSFMNKKVCISTNGKVGYNVINCQNGLCLREMQLHYFHNHYAYKAIHWLKFIQIVTLINYIFGLENKINTCLL